MTARTMADFYELLGVQRNASPEEIKRAFRRQARALHPDANPDDPEAEARFREVARAYETLSDPERRRHYDRFGDVGAAGGGGDPFGGAGFGDLFSMLFGEGFGPGGGQGRQGPARGPDLEARVQLEFEQAAFGDEVPVTVRTAAACDACEATGAAPGTTPETCVECGGSGQVRRVRQSLLGQMVTAAVCGSCAGQGVIVRQPCAECAGEGRSVVEKTYTVDIPAGIDDGQTLRLPGRGAVGVRGGGAGDLFVHVAVRPHDRLVRRGDDLVAEIPVSFAQAALGARLAVETLDEVEEVVVAPGTQSGEVVVIAGRGVPRLQGRGRGDLHLHLVVRTPTDLTEEEAELLRQLAERRGEEIEPPDEGFFARLRTAFK